MQKSTKVIERIHLMAPIVCEMSANQPNSVDQEGAWAQDWKELKNISESRGGKCKMAKGGKSNG